MWRQLSIGLLGLTFLALAAYSALLFSTTIQNQTLDDRVSVTISVTPTATADCTLPCDDLPDLVISHVSSDHDWPCFEAPHRINISVIVANVGQTTAENFYVYANGQAKFVRSLDPGRGATLTFNAFKNPLVAAADSTNSVLEQNELNNDWTQTVPVLTLTPPGPCTPTPELNQRNFVPVVIHQVPTVTRTPTPASTEITVTPRTPTPTFTPDDPFEQTHTPTPSRTPEATPTLTPTTANPYP